MTVGINDAPSGADAVLVMNEDSAYRLTTASFGFSDPIDASEGEPNSLAAVFITTLPAGGSLSLAGSPITAGQRVSVSSLSGESGLIFTPAADAFGSPYASFEFRVQDDGGTVFGGVDTGETTNTITFNVLPVNDPPTIAPVTGPVYVNPSNTNSITTGTFTALDTDLETTLTFGLVSPSVDNGVIVSKIGTFGTLYVRKLTGDYEFHPNSAAISAILANTSEAFQVAVSDGVANSETSFVVSLIAANRAPELVRRSGTVTTAVTTRTDVISAIAMQTDGKIVAAGYSNGNGDLAVVRYQPNGTLDTSYGGGDGIATDSTFSTVGGMLIQPDGKVVVAGGSYVARFNSDGTADTSFGTNGRATVVSTNRFADATSVAIQADGKLIVVGSADTDSSTSAINDSFAIARLTTNGSVDTSFDGDGYQTVDVGTGRNSTGTGGAQDYAQAVAIQPDGKIVVAGLSDTASSTASTFYDVSVVRLNTDGSLDTSFSGDGKASADYNGNSSTTDDVDNVLIASDGTILVSTPTGLLRFTAHGTLDTSFGSSGKIVNAVNQYASAAIDASGRILIAGSGSLRRYTAAGVADAAFGTNGSIATATSTDSSVAKVGQRVFVQPDGRILIGGSNGSGDFRLQRFNANGTTDVTFGDSTGGLGGTVAHTEGGNPTPIDLDVGVSDQELSPLNAGLGDFDGASLTVGRSGGGNVTDLFGIALGPTVLGGPAASFTISGTNQFLIGGRSFGSFSQSGGVLRISFSGTGSGTTAIPTTALVNEVLQRITYQTTNVTPPPSVQLTWTFSDGNTGSQGGGGALDATGTATVTITATNSAPTGMTLANVTASLRDDENTALATKLADIVVEDDGMGANVLTVVSGFDAESFEIVGNALFLKAGVPLLYETKSSYFVRVRVTDSSIPFSTITKDFTLRITGKPIDVPSSQTATDAVIRAGDYRLQKQGGGTLILTQENTHSGGTVVEAGEIIVRNPLALGSGVLIVQAGARVTLNIGPQRLSLPAMTIAGNGVVDLGMGSMALAAGSYDLAGIRELIVSGRAGGGAMGTGITSAVARGMPFREVGYRVQPDGSLIVGFSAVGDANMDGTVGVQDLIALNAGGKYGTAATDAGWWQGDFNFDGRVNVTDLIALVSSGLYGAGSYLPANTAVAVFQQSSATPTVSAVSADLSLTSSAAPEFLPEPVSPATPGPAPTLASEPRRIDEFTWAAFASQGEAGKPSDLRLARWRTLSQ